ncbi:histidine ammonia-lyase, partial [Streptomyces sp. NPDC059018]
RAAVFCVSPGRAPPPPPDPPPPPALLLPPLSWGGRAAPTGPPPLDNLARIIAVELYAATRAIELRRGLTPAPASQAAIAALRAAGVDGPGPDRFLAPDLAATEAFVRDGRLIGAVESVTGPLA